MSIIKKNNLCFSKLKKKERAKNFKNLSAPTEKRLVLCFLADRFLKLSG